MFDTKSELRTAAIIIYNYWNVKIKPKRCIILCKFSFLAFVNINDIYLFIIYPYTYAYYYLRLYAVRNN